MPLPDGYLPRKGDVLVIHATVKYDVEAHDDSVHVKPKGSHESVIIDRSEVAAILFKKWAPDEIAVHKGVRVQVIAVDDDQVWIKMVDHDPAVFFPRQTVSANELSQDVPEPEPAVVVPVLEPIKPPPSAPDEEIQF